MPFPSRDSAFRASSYPETMKSRHSKAASERTPPSTASRAPGASRAACSASPGRRRVFDGIQAQ